MKLFKNRTVLGIFCIAVSLIICFAITPLVNAGLCFLIWPYVLTQRLSVWER